LALALELGATLAILDDKPARVLARTLGIPVVGTLGVLANARRMGHVALLRPLLDTLVQHNFFMSPELYEQTLRIAGEAP
jgi:predicted nucleic acid-binding protein